MLRTFSILLFCGTVLAAPPDKKEPDVLILNDGEKLIGHLVKSIGATLTFQSDMAGTINLDWSKVKEFHTVNSYAVIPKGVELGHKNNGASIPQGPVTVADQKIEVASKTVAVGDTAFVVPEDSFEKAIHHNEGFLHDWKGGITAGLALVEATQNDQTFTGAVNLVRVAPNEDWLDRRNRTIFDFTAAYGKVTQPGTPDVKTEIYHFDGERDEYFSPRFYAFGNATLDHNYSQGLNLQQQYGGGIGRTVIKGKKQQLDLKVSATFIVQSFAGALQTQKLFGATVADTYSYKLPHGILFNQALTVTPAFNNTNALSALATAGLIMPTYKRLGTNFTVIDTFLNDPPAGFKKNSFQFTAGLTYALR